MKFMKKILLIILVTMLLSCNCTSVFAVLPKSDYVILSSAMRLVAVIIFIIYIRYFIICVIKSKKNNKLEVGKLIKWLIVVIITSYVIMMFSYAL